MATDDDIPTPTPELVDDGATDDTAAVQALIRPEDQAPTERANLAAALTEEERKKIGVQVVDRFERDVSSRATRMQRLKELQEMYAMVAKQKNFPFHKAANVKTPSLSGPNLQIQARLFDMIWPANGKIFTVVAATPADLQFVHLTEAFANAYVRYKMPYMAQGLDDTLHQMTLYGSSFRRTYWDAYTKKVRSDWIPIEDFVVAAYFRSQDPSMSDVPRYTYVMHMAPGDIEAYGADGIFVSAEEVKGRPSTPNRSEFAEASNRIDGLSPDDDDEAAPRQVLEQHCRWRLPNDPTRHPAFDGKEHYVYIVVDRDSHTTLRMSLREEDDPDDKRRFERQQQRQEQEQQQYLAHVGAFQAQQQQMAMAPPTMDVAGPPGVEVMPPGGAPMPGGPPPNIVPPPGPPPQFPPVPPIRKRQVCFFTHFRCFPAEGFYGLGYGDLLYGLTLAENTIINQFIDGVTLKNAKPMFMSRQVRMQRGAVNIQPGEVVEIDGPVNQIKDAIMFLDPPQGDPSTVPLIKMLGAMKDIMVGNSDLMSGISPGSNQTKTGMQILTEQMMTPITVLARRVKEAFRHELDKIWRCWGVFLEDDDVADVVGDGGQPQQIPIGKAMFTPSVHLVPASDPRLKSQRMEDHMQLFQYAMNNPFIAQNPQVGPAIMGKLAEMAFRLFPDGEQLIPLLKPPPPPPPEPKSQLEENVGFLKGEDHPVHPADDDDQHMDELRTFMTSPDAGFLDEKGKLAAMNHMRGHAAQRLQKRGQQLGPTTNGQALFGPMGGRNSGMEGPPNLPPAGGSFGR